MLRNRYYKHKNSKDLIIRPVSFIPTPDDRPYVIVNAMLYSRGFHGEGGPLVELGYDDLEIDIKDMKNWEVYDELTG